MKVLLTSYWSVTVAGGLFTYVRSLMKGLENLGIEVDVLTRDPEFKTYYLLKDGRSHPIDKIKQLVEPNVRSYYHFRFPGIDPWIVQCETERYSMEAASTLFDLERYDLIHAQEIISARAMARVKPERMPLISTIHGAWPREAVFHGYVQKGSPGYEYLLFQDRLGVSSSDRSILPTNWLKNIMVQEIGIPPSDRLSVIPYGMDIAAFQSDMKKPTSRPTPDDGKKVILYPSRLSQEKGHRTLLEALAKLRGDRDDWVCWLVGEGYLRGELEAQCRELGLGGHVHLLGRRDDVPALLAMADLCVHPSEQDNHPYAVMEAQAAGKAVLASKVGGIPELVKHSKTGMLTKPGDAEALRKNLALLLGYDDLRERIGEEAKRWAEREWSLDTMVKRTLPLYEAELAKRTRGVEK